MNIDAPKITDELLGALPRRAKEVLERRFGIGKARERKTLESIGTSYGITRERVRQIEAYGLKKLRSNELIEKHKPSFDELKAELIKRGGISEEDSFLTALARSPEDKNYFRFLLTLAGNFKKIKEDNEFKHRWTADERLAEACHQTLRLMHKDLENKDPLGEKELKTKLALTAKGILGQDVTEEMTSSWISVSKKMGQNKLGEWGLVDSPHISPRGVRDLAYLIMKRHGSPMHFSEVAMAIRKNMSEKAHVQTVHNELIKDGRFVLVGRGLYALKEWGYESGTVRDIILNILNSQGPLPKDKLIEKVLKERHVKLATVQINLQNKKFFKVLEDGRVSAI